MSSPSRPVDGADLLDEHPSGLAQHLDLGTKRCGPRAAGRRSYALQTLIDNRHLFGLGLGYVDAHLLAATTLSSDARLWTRDKRLAAVATRHGLAGG